MPERIRPQKLQLCDAYQCSHPIFLLPKFRLTAVAADMGRGQLAGAALFSVRGGPPHLVQYRITSSAEVVQKGGTHGNACARTDRGIDSEIEILKIIVIFGGAGLFVSSFFLTYGLDLSPGFF
jgi:hypothetical protein